MNNNDYENVGNIHKKLSEILEKAKWRNLSLIKSELMAVAAM